MFNKLFVQKNNKVTDYRENIIYSPMKGNQIPISEVLDDIFANEVMGKSIAIIPQEEKIYSPVNGTVSAIFPTRHAIGILSDSGTEILIHIGIDTVSMNGEGFKYHVKSDSKLKVGQLLIEFDKKLIEEKELNPVTIVIITNSDMYEKIKIKEAGYVETSDRLIEMS